MTDRLFYTLAVGRRIGALIGGIMFLIFGLVPGFFISSHGTLILLSFVTGGPVAPGVLERMLIVAGSVIGILFLGTVSLIVGAIIGMGLGYLSEVVTYLVRPAKKPSRSRS